LFPEGADSVNLKPAAHVDPGCADVDSTGALPGSAATLESSVELLGAAVIESLADGLALIEPDGRMHSLNPAMGELIAHCLPPQGAASDAIAQAVLDLLLRPAGELLGPYEIIVEAVEGQPLTLSVTPTALRRPGGGLVCLVRDMTIVRRSRRDWFAFISQVSHELRTPLQHIQNYATLLQELGDLTSEQRAEFLGIIQEEADRLGSMVDDLLQLSRYEQGRLVVIPRRTELCQLVRRQVAKYRQRALARQISLAVQADGEIWAETDPLRYEQVLGNLLSNAVRYVQAGGVVRVSLKREGGWAVAAVSDNGPGMDAETLLRIFEPFYQGPAGRASGRGAGLGLSIGRQLMEALGGELQVTSCPGQGSTFTLTLPAA